MLKLIVYAWGKVKLLVKANYKVVPIILLITRGKTLQAQLFLLPFVLWIFLHQYILHQILLLATLAPVFQSLKIGQKFQSVILPLVTKAALLDNNMLHLIAQSFSQGVVEPGKRGEIVGELILIFTRQKFCKKTYKEQICSFFYRKNQSC